jgi:hypothetical protein
MYQNIFSCWRFLPPGLLMWLANCILHLVVKPRLECEQTAEIGNFSDYRSSTYLAYEASYVMRICASLKDVSSAVFFSFSGVWGNSNLYWRKYVASTFICFDITLSALFAYIVCLSVDRSIYSVPVCIWILSEWRRLRDAVTCRDLFAFLFSRHPVTVTNNFYAPYVNKVHYFVVSFSYNYLIRFILSSFFSAARLFFPFSYFIPVFLISPSPLIRLNPVYLKHLIAERTSLCFCLLLTKFSVVHEVGACSCVGVSVSYISRNYFPPLF